MTTSERPTLWMVAGPNGSGKSSLYGNTDIEAFDQSVWIINPDLLTQRIHDVEKLPLDEANVQAVIRIEAWLEASIRVIVIDPQAPRALREVLNLVGGADLS